MRSQIGPASRSDQKRLALVTGANAGIGKALSHLLAAKNYSLILTARNEERLNAVAKELNVPVEIFPADLKNPSDRAGLVSLIHKRTPDLVINNAGLGLYGEAIKHPTEEQLEILEVNATAVLHLTLEAAKALRAENRAGTIMNISSMAAFFSYPSFSIYAASKACVKNFSESLDAELSPHHIRVLCACPGKINTDFRQFASKGTAPKKDSHTLPPEQAALHIWHQIQTARPLSIFPWPYPLALLAKLLPKPLLHKILQSTISSRHNL